jgi:hypothetical protein
MTDPDETASKRTRRSGAADAAAPATDPSTPETESLAATTPTAGPVEIHQGAVGRAEGTTITVRQGAVGAARGTSVSMDQSAVGAALAGEVTVHQGVVRNLLARSVAVQQSFVRSVVANEVRIERATGVGFILARRVVGDVRVMLDWRGALAFGAAAGLVMGLVRRVAGGGKAEDRARKGRGRG